MSEAGIKEHSSPIKKPKRLINVVQFALLVAIMLIAMLSQLVTTGFDASKNDPALSDKAAWAPRLKAGMEALYTTSLKGKGAMQPKGGNASLADADVKAAVDYLVGTAK